MPLYFYMLGGNGNMKPVCSGTLIHVAALSIRSAKDKSASHFATASFNYKNAWMAMYFCYSHQPNMAVVLTVYENSLSTKIGSTLHLFDSCLMLLLLWHYPTNETAQLSIFCRYCCTTEDSKRLLSPQSMERAAEIIIGCFITKASNQIVACYQLWGKGKGCWEFE